MSRGWPESLFRMLFFELLRPVSLPENLCIGENDMCFSMPQLYMPHQQFINPLLGLGAGLQQQPQIMDYQVNRSDSLSLSLSKHFTRYESVSKHSPLRRWLRMAVVITLRLLLLPIRHPLPLLSFILRMPVRFHLVFMSYIVTFSHDCCDSGAQRARATVSKAEWPR